MAGQLVYAPGTQGLFAIDGHGLARHLLAPETVTGCGLSAGTQITDAQMGGIQRGTPIGDPAVCLKALAAKRRPDLAGSRVDAHGGVYLVDTNGMKRHVLSPTVIEACNAFTARAGVTAEEVDAIPLGTPLASSQDCQNARADGPAMAQLGRVGEVVRLSPHGSVHVFDVSGVARPVDFEVARAAGLDTSAAADPTMSMPMPMPGPMPGAVPWVDCTPRNALGGPNGGTGGSPPVTLPECPPEGFNTGSAPTMGAPTFEDGLYLLNGAALDDVGQVHKALSAARYDLRGRLVRVGGRILLVDTSGMARHVPTSELALACKLPPLESAWPLGEEEGQRLLEWAPLDLATCTRIVDSTVVRSPNPALALQLVNIEGGIYLVDAGGVARHIPTGQVALDCALPNLDTSRVLAPHEGRGLALGPALDVAACVAMMPKQPHLELARKLIRTPNGAIYVVDEAGAARYMPDAAIGQQCGFPDLNAAIQLAQGPANRLLTGAGLTVDSCVAIVAPPPTPRPDLARKLISVGPRILLVDEQGEARYIPGPGMAPLCGLASLAPEHSLTALEGASIREGATLDVASCLRIRPPAKILRPDLAYRVVGMNGAYLVDGTGAARHLPSLDVVAHCGLTLQNMPALSEVEAAQIQLGAPHDVVTCIDAMNVNIAHIIRDNAQNVAVSSLVGALDAAGVSEVISLRSWQPVAAQEDELYAVQGLFYLTRATAKLQTAPSPAMKLAATAVDTARTLFGKIGVNVPEPMLARVSASAGTGGGAITLDMLVMDTVAEVNALTPMGSGIRSEEVHLLLHFKLDPAGPMASVEPEVYGKVRVTDQDPWLAVDPFSGEINADGTYSLKGTLAGACPARETARDDCTQPWNLLNRGILFVASGDVEVGWDKGVVDSVAGQITDASLASGTAEVTASGTYKIDPLGFEAGLNVSGLQSALKAEAKRMLKNEMTGDLLDVTPVDVDAFIDTALEQFEFRSLSTKRGLTDLEPSCTATFVLMGKEQSVAGCPPSQPGLVTQLAQSFATDAGPKNMVLAFAKDPMLAINVLAKGGPAAVSQVLTTGPAALGTIATHYNNPVEAAKVAARSFPGGDQAVAVFQSVGEGIVNFLTGGGGGSGPATTNTLMCGGLDMTRKCEVEGTMETATLGMKLWVKDKNPQTTAIGAPTNQYHGFACTLRDRTGRALKWNGAADSALTAAKNQPVFGYYEMQVSGSPTYLSGGCTLWVMSGPANTWEAQKASIRAGDKYMGSVNAAVSP